MELVGPELIAHGQFGAVVAAGADGNALAATDIAAGGGSISEAGAIFIYDRVDNPWVQTARLVPFGAEKYESLGFCMAMSETATP